MSSPPLEGRAFSVVVHGDVQGTEDERRSLHDWLCFRRLSPAGAAAERGRYIGYWEPYAASHAEPVVRTEVSSAARALAEAVKAIREGRQVRAGADLERPRKKRRFLSRWLRTNHVLVRFL